MKSFSRIFALLLLVFFCSSAVTANNYQKQSAAELEKLVAPIALYQDNLLSHVLTASTVLDEVILASAYVKEHGGKINKMPEEDWDPSVKALMYTPEVLYKMNEDLNWTKQLGNAVNNQLDDVMAAVQNVRKNAVSSGSLKTSNFQKVETANSIVKIDSQQPNVVYVPYYDGNSFLYNNFPSIITYALVFTVADWWFYNYLDWGHRCVIVRPSWLSYYSYPRYGYYYNHYRLWYDRPVYADRFVWTTHNRYRPNYYYSGNYRQHNSYRPQHYHNTHNRPSHSNPANSTTSNYSNNHRQRNNFNVNNNLSNHRQHITHSTNQIINNSLSNQTQYTNAVNSTTNSSLPNRLRSNAVNQTINNSLSKQKHCNYDYDKNYDNNYRINTSNSFSNQRQRDNDIGNRIHKNEFMDNYTNYDNNRSNSYVRAEYDNHSKTNDYSSPSSSFTKHEYENRSRTNDYSRPSSSSTKHEYENRSRTNDYSKPSSSSVKEGSFSRSGSSSSRGSSVDSHGRSKNR